MSDTPHTPDLDPHGLPDPSGPPAGSDPAPRFEPAFEADDAPEVEPFRLYFADDEAPPAPLGEASPEAPLFAGPEFGGLGFGAPFADEDAAEPVPFSASEFDLPPFDFAAGFEGEAFGAEGAFGQSEPGGLGDWALLPSDAQGEGAEASASPAPQASDDALFSAEPSFPTFSDSAEPEGFAAGSEAAGFSGAGFGVPFPTSTDELTYSLPAFEPGPDAESGGLAEFGTLAEGFVFESAPFASPDPVAFAVPEASVEAPVGLGDGAPFAPAEVGGDGASVAIGRQKRKKEKQERGARRASAGAKAAAVLGVHVTPHAVLAVLLQPQGERYEVIREFVRARSAEGAGHNTFDPDALSTPEQGGGLTSAGEDDVMVAFGQGGGVDLAAEFAGLGVTTEGGFEVSGHAPRAERMPIVFELRDILEECAAAGYDRPQLAFALAPPDVEYAEVVVPAEKKTKVSGKKKATADAAKASGAVRREKLLGLLPKEDLARLEKERITFVPMTPRDGERRFLALLPQPEEPVVESLGMLREQSRYRRVPFRTIEAEVPLLMGLARLVCPAEPNENTAFVRVGTADTLVLLFAGADLHHYELLQSVTATDSPDTICSRVLLQQDVQGVGTVHNVVVMAEGDEPALVQGFGAFYPEARVETIGEGLDRLGIGAGALSVTHVDAAAAALAVTMRQAGVFEESHLLPRHLRGKGRQVELALAWHTLVAGMLLFLSVVFFAGLYFANAAEIASMERQLAEYPPEAQLTVPQLQARIDSLRQAQADIAVSLVQMDSLLVGTDLWTQTLLKTTRAASATGGIWIEDWMPTNGELTLHGFSTGRARVVSLAQRLGATIQEVSFRDLRDHPVFEYRMTFSTPSELPETARYLREQAGEAVPAPAPEALAGIDPFTGQPRAPAAPSAPPSAPPPVQAAAPADPSDT